MYVVTASSAADVEIVRERYNSPRYAIERAVVILRNVGYSSTVVVRDPRGQTIAQHSWHKPSERLCTLAWGR